MDTVPTNHGTHLALLCEYAAQVPKGGLIVELGAGHFSTPALHGIARGRGARVWTYESESAWAEPFLHLMWENRIIIERMPGDFQWEYWSVNPPFLFFIDCDTEDRAPALAKAYADGVRVIIAHDSNREAYGFDWSLYPEAVHHATGDFHTTVIDRR